MVRIVWFVGFVALLIAPRAWAANRVLVIDSLTVTEKLKEEARDAIKGALTDHSFDDVVFADQENPICETLACQVDLARKNKSDYLLLVKGRASGTGYQLSLEFCDGVTGRMLSSDSKECELCDPNDFPKAAHDRTRFMVTRAKHEVNAQKALAVSTPPPTPKPVTPKTPIQPVRIDRGFWEQPTPVVGLGLATVGAGAIGFGIYMLAVDGDLACAPGDCSDRRVTGTAGWISVGTGAAALITGSAMAIWGQDSTSDIRWAVGPRSIGLWGRF